MTVALNTAAEKHACAALIGPAAIVPDFDLLKTKRAVVELLENVSRSGFFSEYTKHDISHCDHMLDHLEWLIPESTTGQMTPADWLLIVLAIYFHDIGMLIAPSEYSKRNENVGFQSFIKEYLDGDNSAEVQLDIDQIFVGNPDKRERFLYEEYVRNLHASRSAEWVRGLVSDSSDGLPQAELIHETLAELPQTFREALAKVCESHHLDDLDDLEKYPVSQPFGRGATSQRANVQYAALILRASDLLHITNDRTPRTTFRLMSPLRPASQMEWMMQKDVETVGPRVRRFDPEDSDSTIIDVHAVLTDPEQYFALTEYLRRADEEIRQIHRWNGLSRRIEPHQYQFPWTEVSSKKVQVRNYDTRELRFTVDNQKTIELLMGGSLYERPGIAVRELLQNAFDAVRLQMEVGRRNRDEHATPGKISVYWNSKNRELQIVDQGTGMSDEVIREHFLCVGSSFYRTKSFAREFPEFYPISRFGIGILSAFMLTDELEVLTLEPGGPFCTHLAIRDVHGTYLRRLLDPNIPEASIVRPHGTSIRLRLRASLEAAHIVQAVKEWAITPPCLVQLFLDASEPVEVGFRTIADHLESLLREEGPALSSRSCTSRFEVKEASLQETEIAFVVERESGEGLGRVLVTEVGDQHLPGVVSQGIANSGSAHERKGTEPFKDSREPLVNWLAARGHLRDLIEDGVSDRFRTVQWLIPRVWGSRSIPTDISRRWLQPSSQLDELNTSVASTLAEHVRNETQRFTSLRPNSVIRASLWAQSECARIRKSIRNGAESQFSVHELNLPLIPIEQPSGEIVLCSISELRSGEAPWSLLSRTHRHIDALAAESGRDLPSAFVLGRLFPDSSNVRRFPRICLELQSWWKVFAFGGMSVSNVEIDESTGTLALKWSSEFQATWSFEGTPLLRGMRDPFDFKTEHLVAMRRESDTGFTVFNPFFGARISSILDRKYDCAVADDLIVFGSDSVLGTRVHELLKRGRTNPHFCADLIVYIASRLGLFEGKDDYSLPDLARMSPASFWVRAKEHGMEIPFNPAELNLSPEKCYVMPRRLWLNT